MCISVGVQECALLGREMDEWRGEMTGAIERKDRRTNLLGLLLVRQSISRWGGMEGMKEVRQHTQKAKVH